jgi:hypothetical protein
MMITAPTNMPARRPKISVAKGAVGAAAMLPTLYIMKTMPVADPEVFLARKWSAFVVETSLQGCSAYMSNVRW